MKKGNIKGIAVVSLLTMLLIVASCMQRDEHIPNDHIHDEWSHSTLDAILTLLQIGFTRQKEPNTANSYSR